MGGRRRKTRREIYAQNAQKADDKFMTNCQQYQSEKTCAKTLDKQKQKCYNMQAVKQWPNKGD